MRNKNLRNKLKLDHETIANLELNNVAGGRGSGSSDDGAETITRPGMPSCWTCYHTHCCRG